MYGAGVVGVPTTNPLQPPSPTSALSSAHLRPPLPTFTHLCPPSPISAHLRPPLPTHPRRHHDRCGRRIKLWIYLHDLGVNERPTIIATGTHNTVYYSMEAGQLGWMSRFSERYEFYNVLLKCYQNVEKIYI